MYSELTMRKNFIALVTNEEGIDTLCKNKIFIELIQNKLINGSMIDDVAGGIYWININLLPVKRTQFIIEELATIIKSLKYHEYVLGGNGVSHISHRTHIPPELAKKVRPYLVMDCTVRANSKMSKKLEFGVVDEDE